MNSYVLRIEGKKPYRFLETLVRSHINFIKRKETSTFCMIEVSVEDYAKIKKIHTSYDIIVVSRKGVPYFLYLWIHCRTRYS